jgi:hypothetical protein
MAPAFAMVRGDLGLLVLAIICSRKAHWRAGICSKVNHTAFHSSVYMLAFGAVAEEHKQSTWSHIKSRIDPPFSTDSQAVATAGAQHRGDWPPPPPLGEHVGSMHSLSNLALNAPLTSSELTSEMLSF